MTAGCCGNCGFGWGCGWFGCPGWLGRRSSNASLIAFATLFASACLSPTTRSWREPSYCSLSSLFTSSRMPGHSAASAEITSELVASSPTMRTDCLPGESTFIAVAP